MKKTDISSLEELYQISKDKLEGKHGQITINFAHHSHVYTGNDVIGNCLQEWLPDYFSHLGVNIQPGEGTQTFPDFIASFGGRSYDVEVKAWNINVAPAFDLANFYSFLDSTYVQPGKIDACYFILGYVPVSDEDDFLQGFTVKKLYLKRIWEITNRTKKYPVGLQVKRGIPHALRPCNFHKKERDCFSDKGEFLRAIAVAYTMFPNDTLRFTPVQWLERVSQY